MKKRLRDLARALQNESKTPWYYCEIRLQPDQLSRDVNKPTFSGYTFFIINPIFELSLEWKFPKLLIIFEIEAHECLIFDHFRFISKENLTKFPIWGSRVAGQVFENLRWGVDNEVTYKKCVNLDAFMTFSVPDLGQCFWQPINESAWPRILINVSQSLIGAYRLEIFHRAHSLQWPKGWHQGNNPCNQKLIISVLLRFHLQG